MDNISNIENYSNTPRKVQPNDNMNTNSSNAKARYFNGPTSNGTSSIATNMASANNMNSSLTDLTNLASPNANSNSSPLVEEQEEVLLDHETKSVIIQTLM